MCGVAAMINDARLDDVTAADSGEAPPAAPTKKRGGGPRTAAGREASKRNSTRHGMRAQVVFPEELGRLIEQRTIAIAARFAPADDYERWLVGQMGVASAKITRVEQLELDDLDRWMNRAEDFWEVDRRAEAEKLGNR